MINQYLQKPFWDWNKVQTSKRRWDLLLPWGAWNFNADRGGMNSQASFWPLREAQATVKCTYGQVFPRGEDVDGTWITWIRQRASANGAKHGSFFERLYRERTTKTSRRPVKIKEVTRQGGMWCIRSRAEARVPKLSRLIIIFNSRFCDRNKVQIAKHRWAMLLMGGRAFHLLNSNHV